MRKEELLAAMCFFEEVKSRMGTEDFLRHEDLIVGTTAEILETWRSQGGDIVDLLEKENMVIVLVLICSAQDYLDGMLQRKEETYDTL